MRQNRKQEGGKSHPLSSLFLALYCSFHPQQIALRLTKLLQHSFHLGTSPSLRSMPHALLTLSVLPSAQPIKLLVSLKSCLPPITLVIGNGNKLIGVLLMAEGNSLLTYVPVLRQSKHLTWV